MAKKLEFYRWAGWLLAVSGVFGAGLAGYFHSRVEAATAEEQSLGEDAGLEQSSLRTRIRSLQGRIAEYQGLQVSDQVQAIALLTRLGSHSALLPELQFSKQGRELHCRLTASGSEADIWSFLNGFDALHAHSRGSISLRSFELTASTDGRVALGADLAMLTREEGKSDAR